MSCQPRNPKESFLRRFGLFIAVAFIIQTICNVVAFEYGLIADQQLLANLFDLGQPSVARTMIFAQIILFELVFVFVCKSDTFSLRTMFNDKNINLSVLLSLAMLLLVIYVPYLQTVFKTSSLALEAWGILVLLSLPALSVSWVANHLQSRFSKSLSSS
jgi:Ca2+-transporting ATPase